MSRNVIIAIVVAVVLVGGGAAWYLLSRDSSEEGSTTQSSEQQASGSTNTSLNSITNAGQAQYCSMQYSGPNGNSSGTIYTDGNGRGRYTFASTSDQGNSGETNQIVKDNVAYTWIQTDGETIGFKTDLSTTTSESPDTSTGSSTSSSAPDPDQEFSMNCSSWSVEESQFELPAGVNFIDASSLVPTVPQQP